MVSKMIFALFLQFFVVPIDKEHIVKIVISANNTTCFGVCRAVFYSKSFFLSSGTHNTRGFVI